MLVYSWSMSTYVDINTLTLDSFIVELELWQIVRTVRLLFLSFNLGVFD